jgi:putative transcriptional regulator
MRERTPGTSKSLAGTLLLAHPSLRDANFRRTVVLMTADAAEGAMGVILNRPAQKRLGELGGDFALGPLASVPIFKGGPVQTEQLILAAWQVQEQGFQLHLGLDPEKAVALLAEEGIHLRAFFGYAGWSAGQLKNELKHQSWVRAEAPKDLFALPGEANLWRDVLGREGSEWRLLADEPEEPGMN